MEDLLLKIQNPINDCRPIPFWSWNDKLEPEMLKWQISEMKKAGLGGFFMHARGGLQTGYMGKEWMDCIKTCIEEGRRLGIDAWCYDEEGWPSGFAGGKVTELGDEYHVRWLEMEAIIFEGVLSNMEDVLGLYRKSCGNIFRIEPDKAVPGEELLVIRHKSNPYYIDILNDKVVKKYIEFTHERYYEVFKNEFGSGVKGFFTDEPQFSKDKIPWSNILPDRFSEKYSYHLPDVLPLLFVEADGYEKVRYDFWQLVNSLYTTSFGKQIYDWCREHNCKFTGHVMNEDSLFSQMSATAGGMPFYEYMDIPGMDWLGRNIESPVIPKQVSSVANQLGKKFVLSEMFALCGWNVSFEELKWVAEWQYVNGINLMCQHLEGYSLKGLRKRDYPPSLFYQQPWWKEYKLFNDYFSRLGAVLTKGKQAAEVLLLHPMKSAWLAYNGNNTDDLKRLDGDFRKVTVDLQKSHIDHHYGDETLIGKYGRVEGKRFIVGECAYKAVVLPSMLTIDSFTLELLISFLEQGGIVISMGNMPNLCEGKSDTRLELLKEKISMKHYGRGLSCLSEIPAVSISGDNAGIEDISCMHRDLGDTHVFFMVNHNQTNTCKSEIKIKGCGKVSRFVAENGVLEDIEYTVKQEETEIKLDFLPMQSYVLIFEPAESKGINQEQRECRVNFIRPQDEWKIEDMDLNALTLDYCKYSINGGEWEGPVHTIKLMQILLNRREECEVALKFSFEIDMDLNKNEELYIVVEEAGEFEININGFEVEYSGIGWWRDSSFEKTDIKKYVRNGINEVILKRKFHQNQKVYDVLFGEDVLETERNKLTYDVELESIYILGDFGVTSKSDFTCGKRNSVFTDGPFVITDKIDKVATGDLTVQGLCFFSGEITLSSRVIISKNEFTKYIFEFGKPFDILTRIYVNGREAGVLPWAPYSSDITEYLLDGENEISVKLYSGNRNLLGPHHNLGESYSVAPSTFYGLAGWEEKQEYGIEPGTDVWNDRYCFVKFGIGPEEDKTNGTYK